MRRLAAVSLTALAFAAASCGEDDEQPASGGQSGTNQAPQQDDGSVDPAEGTPAPEGSSYGEKGDNEPGGDR